MSKRRADVELNQDNWDDDTTVQKSQPFEKADKDSLAARKIISISGARSSVSNFFGICSNCFRKRGLRVFSSHLLDFRVPMEFQLNSILEVRPMAV